MVFILDTELGSERSLHFVPAVALGDHAIVTQEFIIVQTMNTGEEFVPREAARDAPNEVQLVAGQAACQDVVTLRPDRGVANDAAELAAQNGGRFYMMTTAVQPADDGRVRNPPLGIIVICRLVICQLTEH